MKRMKSIFSLICALILALSLLSFSASAETVDVTELYKNRDTDSSWSEAEATAVDLSALTENLVITAEGDYVLSGETTFSIIINADEEAKVRLILNGVTIQSAEGPAIRENVADKLILTLAEGTVNTLSDTVAVTEGEDTLAAPIYTEDDLSINGTGTLVINGNTGHGIHCKADLIIAGGTLNVTALKDGIRGRNSALVLDGTVTVNAQGDGIASTRDDKDGKGWVVIAGGTVTITTGSGAGEAVTLSSGAMGGMGGGFGGMGGRMESASTGTTEDSTSMKGIKAATDLTVLGGTLVLDCEDDGLHANNITVSGGTLTIKSGDDGMHADTDLVISGGTVNIPQCFEGLEGFNVTVSGGEVTILSSDDGINAAGGSDGANAWGNMSSEMDNGSLLSISGGTVSVTAGNDGLDSNGSIQISGGLVGVWTAANSVDGSLDYNGTGTMTGGTLILAVGTSSTALTAGLSGQTLMGVILDSAAAAGSVITLQDGSGNVLGTYAPQSSYSTIIVASSSLAEGSACSILVDGTTVYSGNMTSNVTSGGGFGGMGGMGGGPGGQH